MDDCRISKIGRMCTRVTGKFTRMGKMLCDFIEGARLCVVCVSVCLIPLLWHTHTLTFRRMRYSFVVYFDSVCNAVGLVCIVCVSVYSSTAYLLGYHRSFHSYAVGLRLNAKRLRFQPAPTLEWKKTMWNHRRCFSCHRLHGKCNFNLTAKKVDYRG